MGVVGWFGVSQTPYPSAELPFIISGGAGGLFFLGLGAVLLIAADLRDEWRQLDRLEIELDAFEALAVVSWLSRRGAMYPQVSGGVLALAA